MTSNNPKLNAAVAQYNAAFAKLQEAALTGNADLAVSAKMSLAEGYVSMALALPDSACTALLDDGDGAIERAVRRSGCYATGVLPDPKAERVINSRPALPGLE